MKYKLIKQEELSSGTLTQTSVHPREVVKKALKHNAAAVIFAHNHPSGRAEASAADVSLTHALKQAFDYSTISLLPPTKNRFRWQSEVWSKFSRRNGNFGDFLDFLPKHC